jgi:acetyl/propionyl-CoA carboxylase alpha subunit
MKCKNHYSDNCFVDESSAAYYMPIAPPAARMRLGGKYMATDVILPKLGFSMTEGTIEEWLAGDGAQVAEGQALFVLEAEKSAVEVESPATGTLHIRAEVGETYECGTVIGFIE